MTRCMPYFQFYIAQLEFFAVFCLIDGKYGFRIRTIYNRSACCFGKIQMTTYKIRMKMSFEYIGNGCAPLPGQLDIGVNIPQRVYDGSFSLAFNIVGSFAQATGI